jgi:hypothetical protein
MPHTLDSAIKGQIKNLFHEFMTEYLLPKIDQPQIQLIETSRTEASKNWEAIKALRTKGESITDDVLKKIATSHQLQKTPRRRLLDLNCPSDQWRHTKLV